MANITRTFTPDQLEEIGVPHDWTATGPAAECLHEEQTDTHRWVSIHELVFRAPDDGKTYSVTYQQGLTEHQECDRWFDDDQIIATEVEEREVTVKRWLPIETTAPDTSA